MKIHILSKDPRQYDSDFSETCGSFDTIGLILKKGLRQLGFYTDNIDEATHVGIADSLATDFNIPGKKCFIICFVDTINTVPSIVLDRIYNNPHLRIFSINQHTADLFEKYGVDCSVIDPGIDPDYWKIEEWPYTPPNYFAFNHLGFSNFRSGLDQLIQAFDLAFCENKDVRLIIKDTSNSEKLAQKIVEYQNKGNNIHHLVGRWTFTQLKHLYSMTNVACNVLRFSAHGLPIAESTLCRNVCLAGDFDPSNQLIDNGCGMLLKPEKEVYVDEIMSQMVNEWGLVDTFNHLSFPERPRVYSYNIEQYASLLKDVYTNYPTIKQTEYRSKMVEKWDYLKSAQNLVNGLI